MSRTLRRSVVLFAAAVLVAMLAPGASAQDQDGDEADHDDQIVLTGSLVVPAGETVDTAVILDGDALIEGTVRETLVVFNGDTEITGSVGEDLVSFNGAVVVRSGAEIGSDIISRRAPQVEDGATVGGEIQGVEKGLDLGDWELAGRIFWWVGYSVSTLLLGLVLLRLARGLDVASTRALERRTLGVFGFGALAFFLLPVGAALLFVTVVALPLGLFLLLALGFLYTTGYVVGAIALGRQVVKAPTSRYLAFLAGWGALRVAELVPYLGGLAWIASTIIGLGVVWVAARSTPPDAVPSSSIPPAPATA
jgi:hypothetical protein